MKAPRDSRVNRLGIRGDPWRLVSQWNLIEDYPDVGFVGFINNEVREEAFEYLHTSHLLSLWRVNWKTKL